MARETQAERTLGMRGGARLVIKEPGVVLDLDLAMDSGEDITGIVVDHAGEGVAGLVLHPRLKERADQMRYRIDLAGFVTQADGSFVFLGMPPVKVLALRIPTGGAYVDAEVRPGEENRIVLPYRGAVRGRVVWPGGEAPAGRWTVSVIPTGKNRHWTAVPDPDGSFEMSSLAADTWTLEVRDLFGRTSGNSVTVEVGPGLSPDPVELRPEMLATIEGDVVDATGQPKPSYGFRIEHPEAGAKPILLASDASGRFRVDRVPPGEYVFTADEMTQRVEAQAGDLNVRLVIDKTKPVLEGTVLAPSGKPLPQGELVVRKAGDRRWQVVNVRGGTFRHEFAADVGVIEVVTGKALDANGKRLSVKRVFLERVPVAAPLTIRLETAPRATGVVVDESGAPVSGARIAASRPGPGMFNFYASPNREVMTDEAGRFELVSVPEQGLRVDVYPVGDLAQSRGNLARPNEDVRIVVKRAGKIAGTIVDEDGQPIAGASVSFSGEGVSLHANADAQGVFEVQGIPKGMTGRIQALVHRGPYQQYDRAEIREGQLDLRVVMKRAIVLKGRLLDPAGNPVQQGRIQIAGTTKDGARLVTYTSVWNGAFEVKTLNPGTYTLTALGVGPWIGSVPHEITLPDDDGAVELHMRAGIEVSGKVVGKDVDGLMVYFRESEAKAGVAKVGTDGTFRIGREGNVPGTLYVIDNAANRVAVLRDVTPPSTGLSLELQPGQTIAGTVTNRATYPGGRLYVRARGAGVLLTVAAEDKGAFTLRGLPPGTYKIDARVWYDSKGYTAEAADVAAGTKDLTLQLSPVKR